MLEFCPFGQLMLYSTLACCPSAPMNGQLMLEFPDHFWVTAQVR